MPYSLPRHFLQMVSRLFYTNCEFRWVLINLRAWRLLLCKSSPSFLKVFARTRLKYLSLKNLCDDTLPRKSPVSDTVMFFLQSMTWDVCILFVQKKHRKLYQVLLLYEDWVFKNLTGPLLSVSPSWCMTVLSPGMPVWLGPGTYYLGFYFFSSPKRRVVEPEADGTG